MIRALPEKHAFCLTFGEASSGTVAIAKERLQRGASVMLDNGAFSAFKRGERMTRETAAKVLDWYESFPGGDVLVVAPDVIGDGRATARLQAAFAVRLLGLYARFGVIVPVQGTDVPVAVRAWRRAVERIGDNIIAGIPSSRAAWTADMVREFCHLSSCRKVHFLGGSNRARKALSVELRLEASSDSGFASIASANTAGRMSNLPRFCALAEKRVAGIGARLFQAQGQMRWPWAWA